MRKTIGLLSMIASLMFIMGCSKEDPPLPGEKTQYPGTTVPSIPTNTLADLLVFRQNNCALDEYTNLSIQGTYYTTIIGYSSFSRNCSSGASASGALVQRDVNATSEYFYINAETQFGLGYWKGYAELFPNQCRYLELGCDGYMGGDAFAGYDSDLGIGTITFWVDFSTCFTANQISISIDEDGNYIGNSTVNASYESDNHCSNHTDVGYRLDLPEGTYHYRADEIGTTRYWDGNVTIYAGDCRTFKLWCN